MAAAKAKPETPTKIRSDVMDIKRKSQVIDFFGNVVVEKDDSSMLAQKMTIFYEEEKENKSTKKKDAEPDKALAVDPKNLNPVTIADKPADSAAQSKKSSIKRIDAKENVKIFTEDFIASGDVGYYDPSQDIFVLEQNVIVNNGTSIASGSKFVYNLGTKKGNFIGNRDETSIVGRNHDKRVVLILGDEAKDQKKSSKKSKNKSETQTEIKTETKKTETKSEINSEIKSETGPKIKLENDKNS
jgi:lipopolysaccharide export system protein LptA